MKTRTWLFLFLIAVSARPVLAQQELALPLQEGILQASLLNPATVQQHAWQLALPSVAFNFAHTGFSLQDISRTVGKGDSLTLDLQGAIRSMAENNYIFTNYNINFLTVGYRQAAHQFGFYAAEKVNVILCYPRTLPAFIWQGNAAFLGQEVNIGPSAKAMKYREYAGSYAHNFAGKIQLGLRLKYLQGLADLSTNSSKLIFHTDTSHYAITLTADYQVNSSQLEEFGKPLSSFRSQNSNRGWAADLGMQYHPSASWTFAASLLDLGSIRWKRGTHTYGSKGTFTFEGVDAFALVRGDTLSFIQYGEMLEKTFGLVQDSLAYRTQLQPKAYISAKFRPDNSSNISLQLFKEVSAEIHPALTLGYSRTFVKPFNLPFQLSQGVYWSYKNRSAYNLGMAGSLQWKSLQLYLAGDNLLSILLPKARIPLNRLQPLFSNENTRGIPIPKQLKNYNFRFGINLILPGKLQTTTHP